MQFSVFSGILSMVVVTELMMVTMVMTELMMVMAKLTLVMVVVAELMLVMMHCKGLVGTTAPSFWPKCLPLP